jgi:hypothetical protein
MKVIIGVFQEFRAKGLLDSLALLSRAPARVFARARSA